MVYRRHNIQHNDTQPSCHFVFTSARGSGLIQTLNLWMMKHVLDHCAFAAGSMTNQHNDTHRAWHWAEWGNILTLSVFKPNVV
jgi:hypothetical protein